MTKKVKELSVFFPAVNEGENISETVLRAKKVLEKVAEKWEIIIVNDGSKDNTKEVSQKLVKQDKRIRLINHKVNRGYGGALKSGFYGAKYNWIVYNDSDGQFDFAEVTRFLEKIGGVDLVVGYRIKRQDSSYRIFLAKGWRLLVYLFFGLKLRDVDCGFKMASKKLIQKIPKLESERGGMINAELAIKAKQAGFKIGQVGVTHYPRRAGRATGSQIRVIIKSFVELFKLRLKSPFRTLPR